MKQLMFDKEFNNIIEELVPYWKTMEEVPEHIKKFITDTASTRVLYDYNTDQYHCSKCLNLLDEQYYCSNCSRHYSVPDSLESKYIILADIKYIKDFLEFSHYYVFDIIDNDVLLYVFCVRTSYDHPFTYKPYQVNDIDISEVYYITEKGITNVMDNKYISFKEYDTVMKKEDFDSNIFMALDGTENHPFLYTDNLTELKHVSFYQYSNIWELKNYFKKQQFSLSSLTYYPIYCKQFEYLVKMKLYQLAVTCSYSFEYGNSFEKIFGVNKKYYPFMKENDISISELEALKIYPTTDKKILDFVLENPFLIEELSKYVDIKQLKTYLESNKLSSNNISEYYDYMKCCEKLGFNLKDKKVLFPKHFIEEHDKITTEMILTTNPDIDEKIKTLSNIWILNKYEDEHYIIFPADSISSLIDESSQQANCVRNYCERTSSNECQIYFMREKNSPNKSLVTIEVRDGKIVQARTKFNGMPSKEQEQVLKKWEQQITPIINSE